ncbi:ZIP family metal transporter [Gephyromycinifex aptenodytis]|uniref:ZIP family metal transporter n=1 Tax=Gephyromycinifex aptenodytis TaxID=2716227 RepID=UPI001447719D|nr:hypothetical protein [Gephyromycinifex aptenodytis]
MTSAALWGSVAASSLLLGAILGILRQWPAKLIGTVLAFGGGALIASVSFELAEEGLATSGPVPLATGLAAGALTYYAANRAVEHLGQRQADPKAPHLQGRRRQQGGTSLAVGAFLDGIPEQAVLGIGLAAGQGVSAALLVAIFVSNLPEAIGSASDMRESGASRASVLRIWLGVTFICALATIGGYALADVVSTSVQGAVNGFAAGALLVMLVDSLVPEAREKGGESAGLVTALGFALAAGLALLS